MIGLVSGLALSVTAFVLPPVMRFSLAYGKDKNYTWWRVAIDFLVFTFGLFASFATTYMSLMGLLKVRYRYYGLINDVYVVVFVAKCFPAFHRRTVLMCASGYRKPGVIATIHSNYKQINYMYLLNFPRQRGTGFFFFVTFP
jgi:hypothetical protein